MDAKRFQSDLTVRPEVQGSPSLLVHFLEKTSSQRALMQSSAITQAEIVSGCECARLQTGFETKYGRYQFNNSTRDQDIQILAVVPKFDITIHNDEIRNNPMLTVIYLGSDDGRIGYFNVESYTELHSGFGYKNELSNQWRLQEGDYIPKETQFTSAPNHEDDIYKLGVMSNTCYIPMWDTTDDAFVVSESLVKKCQHTIIDTAVINIRPDSVPLNLYGEGDAYKVFPEIGDVIRDDGLLMGFRQKHESTFLTDLTAKALSTPEHLHDDLIKAPPGAEIIDIQIFTNQKVYSKLTEPQYVQLMQYQDQHNRYYAKVIDVYEKLKAENHKFGPEFINLITKYKGWCYFKGGKQFILTDKKEPIEFIRVKITYSYQESIGIGSKLTGQLITAPVYCEIHSKESELLGSLSLK